RVPHAREPAEDVEARDMTENEHYSDADEPEGDLQQATVAGPIVERRDGLDGVVKRAHEARLSRGEDGRKKALPRWCRGRRVPERATASTDVPPSGRRRGRLRSRSSAL